MTAAFFVSAFTKQDIKKKKTDKDQNKSNDIISDDLTQ